MGSYTSLTSTSLHPPPLLFQLTLLLFPFVYHHKKVLACSRYDDRPRGVPTEFFSRIPSSVRRFNLAIGDRCHSIPHFSMFDVAPGFTGSPPALPSSPNISGGYLRSLRLTALLDHRSSRHCLPVSPGCCPQSLVSSMLSRKLKKNLLTKTAPDSPPSHKQRFVCKDRLYEMSFDPNDPPEVTYAVACYWYNWTY